MKVFTSFLLITLCISSQIEAATSPTFISSLMYKRLCEDTKTFEEHLNSINSIDHNTTLKKILQSIKDETQTYNKALSTPLNQLDINSRKQISRKIISKYAEYTTGIEESNTHKIFYSSLPYLDIDFFAGYDNSNYEFILSAQPCIVIYESKFSSMNSQTVAKFQKKDKNIYNRNLGLDAEKKYYLEKAFLEAKGSSFTVFDTECEQVEIKSDHALLKGVHLVVSEEQILILETSKDYQDTEEIDSNSVNNTHGTNVAHATCQEIDPTDPEFSFKLLVALNSLASANKKTVFIAYNQETYSQILKNTFLTLQEKGFTFMSKPKKTNLKIKTDENLPTHLTDFLNKVIILEPNTGNENSQNINNTSSSQPIHNREENTNGKSSFFQQFMSIIYDTFSRLHLKVDEDHHYLLDNPPLMFASMDGFSYDSSLHNNFQPVFLRKLETSTMTCQPFKPGTGAWDMFGLVMLVIVAVVALVAGGVVLYSVFGPTTLSFALAESIPLTSLA